MNELFQPSISKDGISTSIFPRTLPEVIQNAKDTDTHGPIFLNRDMKPTALSWSQIAVQTEKYAGCLESLGVKTRDRVCLVIPDEREFVPVFLGLCLIGAIPVPAAPMPLLGNRNTYLLRTTATLKACAATHLIGWEESIPDKKRLQQDLPTFIDTISIECIQGIASEMSDGIAGYVARPSDICYIQFTSGSTGDPKGVMVSYANLAANIIASHRRLESDRERDFLVSWLPLFHDLGLIGSLITPIVTLLRIVYIPTATFAYRPRVWLETVHKYRGTITSSNLYGLNAAVKRRPSREDLDLSCLRVLVVGTEPIQAETVRNFVDAFGNHGLRPEAVTTGYGLAEATLTITSQRPDEPFLTQRIARHTYEVDRRAVPVSKSDTEWLEFASCGYPLEGHTLCIRNQLGNEVPEGAVGEIAVSGPSVTNGYFQRPDATAETFRDGWLYTGDFGFVLDGQLYVTGRKKDLVIIGGRNYDPQMIEWYVGNVDGVRSNRVVVFSIPADDGERLVIVAECQNPNQIDGLETIIRREVIQNTGLTPTHVVLIRPWTLPMTSSGKLRRAHTHALFLNEELNTINRD